MTASELENAIGARMCRLRTERGLTQYEMAGRRYTRQFVSAVETGQRVPSSEAIEHFAERLGVDPDDLRYGRPPGVAADLAASLTAGRQALSSGAVSTAVEVFDACEEQAGRWHLVELEAWACYCKGETELHTGSTTSALEHYLRAEKILADAPASERAYVVARRAYCLGAKGEVGAAARLLEQALVEVGPDETEARVRLLTALSCPYFEMGSDERACAALDEALALAPYVRNPEWLARLHINAARAHHYRGWVAAAEESLLTARRLFTELGLTAEAGRCRWSWGYLLARSGRLAEAVEELRAALAVLDAAHAHTEQGGAVLELASALIHRGEFAEAGRLVDQATDLAGRTGHADWLPEADRLRGLIARERGNRPAAESALRSALLRYEQAGARSEVAVTARALGRLLIDEDRIDEGLEIYRRGISASPPA